MKKKEEAVAKKTKTVEKKKKPKKEKKNKEGLIKGICKELKKVTWPDKKDIIKYSIATLVFCIVIMVFFQALDFLLSVIKGVFN